MAALPVVPSAAPSDMGLGAGSSSAVVLPADFSPERPSGRRPRGAALALADRMAKHVRNEYFMVWFFFRSEVKAELWEEDGRAVKLRGMTIARLACFMNALHRMTMIEVRSLPIKQDLSRHK